MNPLKRFRTWAKKIARWYQEVDRIIQSIPKLLLYIVYGSSMFFGIITTIYALWFVIRLFLLIGVLMIILPPIIHLRKWIIGIFSLFWEEMVKPFFLWILWIRTQGFPVLLTREYGIQLGAVLFTCLVLYQFRIPRMFPYVLLAIIIIALALASGSFPSPEVESEYIWFRAFTSGFISLLTAIPATAIPGFFVGFLTGTEGKGMRAVGFGSFLAASVDLVYWASEIFSPLRTDAWGILTMVLVLIGLAILLFIVCGFGMLCGYLGEQGGIKVRRKILKKYGII